MTVNSDRDGVRRTASSGREKSGQLDPERLRFLLSSIPVVIYACAPEPPYRATFITDNVDEVLGYQPRQFIEDPDFWASRVHPEDAPGLFASLQTLQVDQEHVYRYRFRHRDGTYHWMRDGLRAMRGQNGEPGEILGCWLDISETKSAELDLREARSQLESSVQQRTAQLIAANQALAESQERFQQLAENLREVFWLTDPELKKVIYVSRAYEEIWGRSCQDLYAHPRDWYDAIHPEDKIGVQEVFEKAIAERGFEHEYRVVRPDGSVRWVLDHGFPVRDAAGKVYRLAGLARDVTERKELERELLSISEREQRRLGQDLHDDLGQQLVGIGFLANALKQQLKGRPQAALANEIAQLIRTAANLTHRLACGMAPVEMQPEGLMVALRGLANRTSHLFNIRCDFQGSSPILINDPAASTHLFRITQEAITNSIKHGNAHTIKIGLATTDGSLVLTVKDDGKGLAKTKRNGRSGMGLKIMRYRTTTLGGSLDIHPEMPHGTTVVCRVPLAKVQSTAVRIVNTP